MIVGRDPVEGLVYLGETSLNLGSSGPARVAQNEDEECVSPLPPLGFVTRDQWEAAEPDPLLWDGD